MRGGHSARSSPCVSGSVRRKRPAERLCQGLAGADFGLAYQGALSDELVEVVGKTIQSSHVPLWLRPDTAAKKD